LVGVPSLPLHPIGERQPFSFVGVLRYHATLDIKDIKNKKVETYSFRSELKTDYIFFSTPDPISEIYERTKEAVESNERLRALVKTRAFPPPEPQWKIQEFSKPRFSDVVSQLVKVSKETYSSAKNLAASGCEGLINVETYTEKIVWPALKKFNDAVPSASANTRKFVFPSFARILIPHYNDYVLKILNEGGPFDEWLQTINSKVEYIESEKLWPVTTNQKRKQSKFTNITALTEDLVSFGQLVYSFQPTVLVGAYQVIDVLSKALQEIGSKEQENVDQQVQGYFFVAKPSSSNSELYDAVGVVSYNWHVIVNNVSKKLTNGSTNDISIVAKLLLFYSEEDLKRIYEAVA